MKIIKFHNGPHGGETAKVNKDVEVYQFHLSGERTDEKGNEVHYYDEYKPKKRGLLDFFFGGMKHHKSKPIDYSQDDQ